MADAVIRLVPLSSVTPWGYDVPAGTAGANLTSDVPQLGGAWAYHAGYPGVAQLAAGSPTRVRPQTTSTCLAYLGDTVPTANYSVSAWTILKGLSTRPTYKTAVVGRLDPSSTTYYMLELQYKWQFDSQGLLTLYAVTPSGTTQLAGTTFEGFFAGNSYKFTLRMIGNQISGLLDDVVLLGPVTDSAISGAGKAGISFSWTTPSDANGLPIGQFQIGDSAGVQLPAPTIITDSVLRMSSLGTAPGLATPTVRLDSVLQPGPNGATAGLPPAGTSTDARPTVSALGASPTLIRGAVAAEQVLTVLALGSTGTVPSVATLTSRNANNTVVPLAATAGLPAPGLSYGYAVPVAPLAATAGVATWPVTPGSGALVTATPLGAAGTLPAPTVSASTIYQVAALSATAGLVGVSIATDGSIVISPPPLAAPAELAPLSASTPAAIQLSPLAAPGGLASSASTSAILAVAPLTAEFGIGPYINDVSGTIFTPLGAPSGAKITGLQLANVQVGDHITVNQVVTPLQGTPTLFPVFVSTGVSLPIAPLAAPGVLAGTRTKAANAIALTPLVATPTLILANGNAPKTDARITVAALAAPAHMTEGVTGGITIYVDPGAWARIGPDAEGSVYPFVTPSADIRNLIAEACLTFAATAYRPPLRVAWIHGLDKAFALPPGLPADPPPLPGGDMPRASDTAIPDYTPTHDCDAVIWDAQDNVIFDSTAAGSYAGSFYGPYFFTHRWDDGDRVLRITQRVRFPGVDQAYAVPSTIKPRNGVLDERVGEVACPRVESIGIDGEGYAADGRVALVEGYNTTAVGSATRTTQAARTSGITVAAEPGSGLGLYRDCDGGDRAFDAIGQLKADANGNVSFATDGCYTVRPEIKIQNDVATITPGKLLLGNDCKPCCSCADYAALATQLTALWNELQVLANEAEHARDRYMHGLQRFGGVQSTPVTLAISANSLVHNLRYVDFVVQVCHQTDDCLEDVEVHVDLSATIAEEGVEFPPRLRVTMMPDHVSVTGDCGVPGNVRPSRTDANATVFIMGEPTRPDFITDTPFRIKWHKILPRSLGVARFRFLIDGVNYNKQPTVQFTVLAPGYNAGGGTAPAPIPSE
jgi:hypothetical protein